MIEQQTDAIVREAQRQQQELRVGDAALKIARILHGKGYQVELLAPHIAFVAGQKEEQMAVRLRWIAPGSRAGQEAVVLESAIDNMIEQAKAIPSANVAGILTPLPSNPANKPKSFA